MAEPRRLTTTYHEGNITCPYCGEKTSITKKDRNCQHCSQAIGEEDFKQEISAGAELSQEEGADLAQGETFDCKNCDTKNIYKKSDLEDEDFIRYCENCGDVHPDDADKASGRPEEEKVVERQDPVPVAVAFRPAPPKPPKSNWLGITAGIIAVIALFFAIWFFLFRTTQEEVVITGFYWEASVPIQAPAEGEGWSKPSSAYDVTEETRHKEDLENSWNEYSEVEITTTPEVVGEGIAPCPTEISETGVVIGGDCAYPTLESVGIIVVTSQPTKVYGTPTPVYDTYYFYTFIKHTGESDTTSGRDNTNIYLPSESLAIDETYDFDDTSYTLLIYVAGYDEPFSCFSSISCNMQDFESFIENGTYTAEVNPFGDIVDIHP